MKFNLEQLRQIISHIKAHKIQNINVQSNFLKLIINDEHNSHIDKRKITILPKTLTTKNDKLPTINYRKHVEDISTYSHSEKDIYYTIISPMIGTFYRSPGPNEMPFISVNENVKSNQTVCIIEAMKLMNEIEAEVNGIIIEIMAQDGDIVDCGQALMKIKPS